MTSPSAWTVRGRSTVPSHTGSGTEPVTATRLVSVPWVCVLLWPYRYAPLCLPEGLGFSFVSLCVPAYLSLHVSMSLSLYTAHCASSSKSHFLGYVSVSPQIWIIPISVSLHLLWLSLRIALCVYICLYCLTLVHPSPILLGTPCIDHSDCPSVISEIACVCICISPLYQTL